MVPDFVLLYAVVVVFFSLAYFFFASPPFLLVRLDLPDVSRLFRGLFNVYFWMVGCTCLLATVVFALGGRLGVTIEMLLIATTAIVVRKKVLQRIDLYQDLWQSGDTGAMRRLRQIHWGVMLANIVVLASVASSVSYIL